MLSNDSRLIDWLLRVAIAMQAFGYAWLLGVLNESPLLGWLWEPTDVGGLALGESVGLVVCRVLAAVLAVAGVMTLFWPARLMLLVIVAFQVIYTYAIWQIDAGFPLDTSWIGKGWLRGIADQIAPLLPFATNAARMALPLVMVMVHWSTKRKLIGISFGWVSELLMRVSIALTFFGHGLEALAQHPKFIDMILVSSQRLLGMELSEQVAQVLLVTIGVIDLTVAVMVVVFRSRWVAGYMAFWGFITAAARLIVLPTLSTVVPGYGASEFCQRASHWALPLLLLLAWRTIRVRVDESKD